MRKSLEMEGLASRSDRVLQFDCNMCAWGDIKANTAKFGSESLDDSVR
jgi:hypothetical protein